MMYWAHSIEKCFQNESNCFELKWILATRTQKQTKIWIFFFENILTTNFQDKLTLQKMNSAKHLIIRFMSINARRTSEISWYFIATAAKTLKFEQKRQNICHYFQQNPDFITNQTNTSHRALFFTHQNSKNLERFPTKTNSRFATALKKPINNTSLHSSHHFLKAAAFVVPHYCPNPPCFLRTYR